MQSPDEDQRTLRTERQARRVGRESGPSDPTSVQSITNRLRSAFARRFLLSVRRATHRLPVQLETLRRQRVMVVAPHMDDEVIGCGGTLLLHRTLQSEVRVVFVSDSSGAVGDPASPKVFATSGAPR